MMPGGPGGNPQQQYPNMQQGGYPMMQQGHPQMMMPPGQMMQGQMMPTTMQQQMMAQAQMQQAYHTNPFLNPGGFMPMQGHGGFATPGQSGRFPNPGYNQQVVQGKEQRQLEEQKRRAEEAAKQRRIQEQQKRLKEFSAIGGRKMDADSLIDSILGPKSGQHARPPNPGAMAPNPGAMQHNPGAMPPQGVMPPQGMMPHPGSMPHGMMHPGMRPPGVAPPSYSAALEIKAATQNSNGIPPQGQSVGVPTTGMNNGTVIATEGPQGGDDFSDFMTGPATQQPTSQPIPPPVNQSQVSSSPGPATPTGIPPPAAAAQKDDKKQDLMSMMMECSDLSQPKEAKGFRKPKVNEVQVSPKQATSFQQSKTARQWGPSNEQLSEMFHLPPEEIKGYPKWLTGKKAMPDVYIQVLEASTKEEKIDTDVVYSILLRSNLPREVLGHIWSISNKHTPGQLIKEELFLMMGMISVAQNNLNWQTLDILHRCPQAPIPNLGQGPSLAASQAQAQTPAQSGSGDGSQSQTLVSQTPPTYSQAPHQHPPAVGTGVHQPPPGAPQPPPPADDDDFADFQAAPTIPAPNTNAGFISAPPPSGVQSVKPAANQAGSLMGNDDKYSVFKLMPEPKALETNMDTVEDDFDDFKSVGSSSTTTSSGLGDQMPPGMMNLSPAHSSAGIPPPVLSASFGSMTLQPPPSSGQTSISNSSSTEFSDFQGPPPGATSPASAPAPAAPKDDKYSALKAMIMDTSLFVKPVEKPEEKNESNAEPSGDNDDDWAGFQDAGTASFDAGVSSFGGITSAAGDDDKYSVFKSTSDSSGGFSTSQPATNASSDGWAAFSSAPAPVSADNSWTSSIGAKTADFGGLSSSDGGKTDYSNDIISDDDFFKQVSGGKSQSAGDTKTQSGTTTTSTNISSSGGIKAGTAKAGVDKKKAFGMFARNLDVSAPAAGTGMSPLDITPPDMPPELPPDDIEGTFDKFGILSGGIADEPAGDGISSLATPYGDLDDFGDFATGKTHTNPNRQYNLGPLKVNHPTKDTSDSQSVNSMEFTGWTSKEKVDTPSREDTKSTHSLELRSQPGALGSQDSSPAGGDSQSVSSLEFPAAAERKSATPADSRSVSSLELKAAELAAETSDSATPEGGDDFGDFNSAQTNNEPTLDMNQKPREASELINQGNMLSVTLGDRYSGLSAEPQDSDRHVYDWTRCVNKCCEMIREANNTLNSVSSSIICNEVLGTEQGIEYFTGIVEIYRVACRIKQSMKSSSISNARLHSAVQDLEMAWDCLKTFISSSKIMPNASRLDFSSRILKAEQEGAQQKACGICLMDVTPPANTNVQNDTSETKLAYAGREYHAACANFWVNCVDSTLPSLKIPELL